MSCHDVMEEQRLVRLIDERCDVAAVDRVFDVFEFARGAQAFEQPAEGFAFVHMTLFSVVRKRDDRSPRAALK